MSETLHRFVVAILLVTSAWGQAVAEPYVFSAPPGLDAEQSRSIYAPLMNLLSRETGAPFLYAHPESWFAYQRGIRSGRFQLLLDDAHFASWRIAALNHAPVVAAREEATFVTITMKDGRIYSKEDLIGQPVCGKAPPDLGTLGFLEQFEGPFQVPQILPTPDPLDRVQNLLTGVCEAAVLARYHYTDSSEIRGVAARLKIITQTESYPGLTLTAGPGVPEDLRANIRTVLLSRAGGTAAKALRDRYANGSHFIEARPEDYDGLHGMLRDYPGFDY